LDQKINSEQSLFLFGFEYQPKNILSSEIQEKQAYAASNSKLKRVFGFSYLYPLAERESSFGPQLELETSRAILGVSFHKGNNKVQTLSKGVYSMIPIYGLWKQYGQKEKWDLKFLVGFQGNLCGRQGPTAI